jgi:hypothetical protein
MLEALIKCGCFDAVHGRDARCAMIATIEQALSAGQKLASDKAAGQGALFGGAPAAGGAKAPPAAATLARAEKWTEGDTLKFEKEALGFFVSSHPLDQWKYWSQLFTTSDVASVKQSPQDARVIIAGIVQNVRALTVKQGRSAGQKMGVVTIEDATGSVECVMFADAFAKTGHLAETDRVVFLLGRADLSRGEPQILADKLVPIEGLPLLPGRLQFAVDELRLNGGSETALRKLRDLLLYHVMPHQVPVEGTISEGRVTLVKSAGTNGIHHAAGKGAANGTVGTAAPAVAVAKPVESRAGLHGMGVKSAEVLFPVELAIGTASAAAILTVPGMKVALAPELVKAAEGLLGPRMVRVVGGVAVELNERKVWEKKNFRSDRED